MRLPTLFLSHGGGPWPFMRDRIDDFGGTFACFQKLPSTLPVEPKAILSVSGHWEEPHFTVATSERPPMVYDYYGLRPVRLSPARRHKPSRKHWGKQRAHSFGPLAVAEEL